MYKSKKASYEIAHSWNKVRENISHMHWCCDW